MEHFLQTSGQDEFGQSMTCTAVKGDWAQVMNSNGAVGYCCRYALGSSNPNKYNNSVYAAKTKYQYTVALPCPRGLWERCL